MQKLTQLDREGQAFFVTPDADEWLERKLGALRIGKLVTDIRSAPAEHPLRTTLLKEPLLPYQLDGIAFAAGAGRAVLADEMGLGKTIQGVGVAELLAREVGITKILVVCPASLKSQWRSEIERFSGRSTELVAGSAEDRGQMYAGAAFFTICNYEQVLKDIAFVEKARWDLVILDEGQRIPRSTNSLTRIPPCTPEEMPSRVNALAVTSALASTLRAARRTSYAVKLRPTPSSRIGTPGLTWGSGSGPAGPPTALMNTFSPVPSYALPYWRWPPPLDGNSSEEVLFPVPPPDDPPPPGLLFAAPSTTASTPRTTALTALTIATVPARSIVSTSTPLISLYGTSGIAPSQDAPTRTSRRAGVRQSSPASTGFVQPCSVSKLTRLSGVTGRVSPSSSSRRMMPSDEPRLAGLRSGAYPFEVQPTKKIASAP